jgi:CO/xanthine dehydrogenase Mo-binding subunit
MLFARLVRAPQAGLLVSMQPGEELPEGYHLCSVKDVPGKKQVSIPGGHAEIFASGVIPNPGCPVGLVAGPDRKVVDSIVSRVTVLVNARGITRRAEVVAARDVTFGERASEDVFNAAEQRVSGFYRLSLMPATISECAGAVADWKEGRLTIYTATEWARHLRESLAVALGISASKITIKKTILTEHNTNGAWLNTVLAVQAAVASRLCRAPVKLSLTRHEHDTYMARLMHIILRHKTAVDSNGIIQGMIIRIVVNGGSLSPFATEILDRLVIAAVGPYRPKNLRITGTFYKTPTPPGGLYFTWLDYGAGYAMESQVQKIAAVLNLSPVEIRRKNVPPPEELSPVDKVSLVKRGIHEPFPFNLGLRYYHETLTRAAKAGDFERKWASFTYNGVSRRREFGGQTSPGLEPIRGIGLAASYTGSAFFGSPAFQADQDIEVMKTAAGHVVINTPHPSKAIAHIWSTIAASELKVDPAKVTFATRNDDASHEPKSPGFMFNNSVVLTYLLKKCCTTLRKQEAKHSLPLSVKRAITAAQRKLWNQADFSGTPFFSTASASVVVELSIDPYTKQDSLLGVWFAIDCGAVYTEKEIEKTVRRACQNIFSRLMPHQIIDPSFIHIDLVESESEAQQIGRLIYKILPAAYLSALRQAGGDRVLLNRRRLGR